MTTRSAGRAISRYETKPKSEHAAMRAVIESAECSSLSVATSPLTTAPVAIWMQPVAAPAAPAICGKGLHRIRRDQAEGEGAKDQK